MGITSVLPASQNNEELEFVYAGLSHPQTCCSSLDFIVLQIAIPFAQLYSPKYLELILGFSLLCSLLNCSINSGNQFVQAYPSGPSISTLHSIPVSWLPWVFSGPLYCLQPVVQFIDLSSLLPHPTPIRCRHKENNDYEGKFHTTTAWFNNPLMTCFVKHQVQMPWRATFSLPLPKRLQVSSFTSHPSSFPKSPTCTVERSMQSQPMHPGILNCLQCKEEGKR